MTYSELSLTIFSKAGWSWGYVSTVDCDGRTIWIADAHRGDGKRFVVRADEKLSAFVNSRRRFALAAIVLTSWRDFSEARRI